MQRIYSILTALGYAFIWGTQFFSKKMRLFVQGRKGVFAKLEDHIGSGDKWVWFHCASLGEFEQALPIIEAIKKEFTGYKILLTFFSPSGYEIKKNSTVADLVTYLPADTLTNAKRFIKTVRPSLAIFVKYEFWPNYLFALEKAKIPAILISGLFRRKHWFFRPYGGFMRKALKTMHHLFVQNEDSMALLKTIGITQVTVSGDTRFDRVAHQIEVDNTLPLIAEFKQDRLCMVLGSTWPEDEPLFIPLINNPGNKLKFIIAPHTMDKSKIEALQSRIRKTAVRLSDQEISRLSEADVLIVDTIGLLTRIYSYADIAYVGGAMGNTGLHNILEPATFGIPIIIGKNFEKFPEAKKLRELAALFSVANATEFEVVINKLTNDSAFRNKTGMIAGHFINSNTGATKIIMEHIRKLHGNGLI